MDDITTTVVPNERGTEDVQILVNESDGATLAPAITPPAVSMTVPVMEPVTV